jgi:DHA1 family tetracycline resistance protein-like MFS transporter
VIEPADDPVDQEASSPLLTILVFAALSASLASGYGVLFTVVGDFRTEYDISEATVGLIIGLGFFAGFLSQVFIAPIGDRGRARQVVGFGVVLNVVGLILIGVGGSVELILFGRFISGIGIGAANPAIRRIVILVDPANLGRNLGWLLSADVFGFALGPAVSAVMVGPFGLAAPFLTIAAVTLVLLPNLFRVRIREESAQSQQRLALDLLADRAVAGGVVLGAGVFLMIGGFDALWDLVHEDLGTNDLIANLGITLFALPLIFLGPVSGILAQRIGPFVMGAAGLVGGSFFMTSYGLLPSGNWIFGFAMFHAITDGLTIAASGVAVSMAVSDDRQAGAQGLIGAAQALTAGTTAIVVGALYGSFGRFVAYGATSAGMLVCVGFALYLGRDFRRRRRLSVAEMPI